MLALQFGVGADGCSSLGHQGIAALHQPGAPGRGKALAQGFEFGHQGVEQHGAVVQQVAQPLAFHGQFGSFLAQAFLFKAREAPQWHRQHRIGLTLAQVELHLQGRPGTGGIGRRGDQGDHLLQGLERLEQALQHLQAVFAALEGVAGAADQGQFPVVQEFLQQAPQVQLHRLAVYQGQHDGAEVALQGGAALQVGQHGFGVGVAAEFNYHPHAFTVAFVADIGDAADLAVVYLLSQFLDPAGFAELVWQLGDHHGAAAMASLSGLYLLDVGDAPHRDAAAAHEVGIADPLPHQHFPAGGKVRAGH